MKLSVDETNCENLCGAKPCESVSLKNRDLAESRETCTMWFYIHLHYVLHHPLLSVLSRLSCASARGVQVHRFGGKRRVRSVENAECGKCGVWKMQSVENAGCGNCGVWKMRSVENK